MATLFSNSGTSYTTFISDLASFLVANGWTNDLVTSSRIHTHKGGWHFELFYSTVYFYVIGCTSYDSGQGSTTQPGTGPNTGAAANILGSTGGYYRFVSTPTTITIFTVNANYVATSRTISFGYGITPIGGWTGGGFYSAGNGVNGYPPVYTVNSYASFSMYVNGAWTPLALAGGANGLLGTSSTLYQKMPFIYNGGLLPIPITLFKRDVSVTSNFHPLGVAPDIRSISGGSIYLDLDTLTYNGQTWTCLNSLVPYAVGPCDFLMRLGS